jgi:hypothetical protein
MRYFRKQCFPVGGGHQRCCVLHVLGAWVCGSVLQLGIELTNLSGSASLAGLDGERVSCLLQSFNLFQPTKIIHSDRWNSARSTEQILRVAAPKKTECLYGSKTILLISHLCKLNQISEVSFVEIFSWL